MKKKKNNRFIPPKVDSDVQEIRRMALAMNQRGFLHTENIIKAVLTHPPARRMLVEMFDLDERMLSSPIPDIPKDWPDDPGAEWPREMIYPEDALLSDQQYEPDLQPFTNLKQFIRKIYSVSSEENWFRPAIGESLEDLQERVDRARTAAVRKFPAQKNAIEALGRALFDQGLRALEGAPACPPEPLFLFAPPGHGATAILRLFAEELGGRFMAIEAQRTSCAEFLAAVEKGPPCLIEAAGFLSCPPGYAAHSILSYYLNGHAARESFAPDELTDSRRSAEELETALRKCIVIFHMPPPRNVPDLGDYTAEELALLLQDQQRDEMEQHPALAERPAPFWPMIRSHNSVIIRGTPCRYLVRQVYRECREALRFIRDNMNGLTFRVESTLQLCALPILERGYPSPKDIRGAMRRLLFDMARAVRGAAGPCTVRIETASGELQPFLRKPTRPLRAWMNALETQARQQSYSGQKLVFEMASDPARPAIVIRHLSLRAPKAVAGGTFLVSRPSLRFRDVIGLEEAKERLGTLARFIRDPSSFSALRTAPPRRLLLAGAPGTGKTLLAQAFAGEVGLPFFAISAAEIMSQKWAGWGGSRLREIFRAARVYQPSVVFLDELDAFGNRSVMGEGETAMEQKSILNTLLVLLDGVDSADDVIVIGATNRPDDLDEALLRPKRFGTRIECEPLKPAQRAHLVRLHLAPALCEGDYEELVQYVAMRTAGPFSPAAIEELVNEGKLLAEKAGLSKVSRKIYAQTIDTMVLGRKFRELSPEYRQTVAYHEAGHALVMRALLPQRKIARLTIGDREDSSGLLMWGEDENQQRGFPLEELLFSIMQLLGGAAAEELVQGFRGTGSGSDLALATKLAALAVEDCGFGLGIRGAVLGYLPSKYDPWPGELYQHVCRAMELCYEQTKVLLAELRPHLDLLAHELVLREDMGEEDVSEVLRSLQFDRLRLLAQLVADMSRPSNLRDAAPPPVAVHHPAYAGEGGVLATG